MSKKFDEEYLTFLRDSSPDIWDRIEKNLDENPKREMPNKKKRSISKKISYFALPIAACIIIAIAIPRWLGSVRMGADGITDTCMNQVCEEECVADYSFDDACVEEACEEDMEAILLTDENGLANTIQLESKIEIMSINTEISRDLQSYLVKIIWNKEGILEEGNEVLLYIQQDDFVMEERKEYHVVMEEKEDGYLLVEILE